MKFKTEFTEQEINILVNGLGKLPAEISFNLIDRLKNEFNDFAKKVNEAKLEESKEVIKKDKKL